MRIALFGLNSGTTFSGGRYYAWMLAEALAYAGHDVSYITNNKPIFHDDFAQFPNHGDIKLFVSRNLRARLPTGNFDVVVMIPDNSDRISHFLDALNFGRKRGARLVLLNFETSNWFNALAPTPRPARLWRGWLRFSREASMILSLAEEGTRYARAFYREVPADTIFTHCYPPINSLVADRVPDRPAEKRIIVITRFESSAHKGGGGISRLFSKEMSGYTLLLMVGYGGVPPAALAMMEKAARRYDIELEIQRCLKDREKFEEIKRCSLMLFPSFFEGFGLPPIESQYCNVPCIAFDLPVLREVSGDGIYFVKSGDWDAFRDQIGQVLSSDRSHEHLRENIADVARFQSFASRIDRVMLQALKVPVPDAVKGTFQRWIELGAQRAREFGLSIAGKLRRGLSAIVRHTA